VARRRRDLRDGEEGLTRQLFDIIRERGPLTVAAFMELALYDSDFGYYARAARRSGRAGDFFTSVDVGPLFGELLARQIIEMAALLPNPLFDLVEAGAGNGRLSGDILRAIQQRDPALYEHLRLQLVEISAEARAEQRTTLGEASDRLASSSADLPADFEGVLVANELLDALPVHQVVMRGDELREVYVEARGDRLATVEGPLSTPALRQYFEYEHVALESGWRAEINLRAAEWTRHAVRALRQGFMILIDYGHQAAELYSAGHSSGTLTTFSRHTMAGPERAGDVPAWLERPGQQDITAHVDFTGVQHAAEREGATTLAFLDQTYFLLGLGAAEIDASDLKTRLALKTLLMPGGLGSTLKVLILGKNVGTPTLLGCSFRVRAT
jgi:SAM-dependent MidA family methyltransferase